MLHAQDKVPEKLCLNCAHVRLRISATRPGFDVTMLCAIKVDPVSGLPVLAAAAREDQCVNGSMFAQRGKQKVGVQDPPPSLPEAELLSRIRDHIREA